MSHEATRLALEVCSTRASEAMSPLRGVRAATALGLGTATRALPASHSGPAVPAGQDLLELDERLRGDIQLIDDRADDVGVVLRLHLHVVAVAVGDREEDPVPDAEDFPVGSTERLGGDERRRGPREPRPVGTAAAALTFPAPSASTPSHEWRRQLRLLQLRRPR